MRDFGSYLYANRMSFTRYQHLQILEFTVRGRQSLLKYEESLSVF